MDVHTRAKDLQCGVQGNVKRTNVGLTESLKLMICYRPSRASFMAAEDMIHVCSVDLR